MPKNIEDIIVPDKGMSAPRRGRSIRDIPIPEGRRRKEVDINFPDRRKSDNEKNFVEESIEPDDNTYSDGPRMPRLENESVRATKVRSYTKRKLPGKKTIISLGVAIVILGFAIMSLFAGATLAYTPKSADAAFTGDTYTANKTGDSGLLFSVVKLSLDKGKQVPATGEQDVEEKASGTIIIYNNTSTSQKLIATTRFETPDGKVYRIADAVTIPGQKTVNGTKEPGSVEAVVYADQPGESYNTGLTDFTVPGLKGDPRYSTIYARSKTAMTGGFVGKMKKVSDENLAAAKSDLDIALATDLTEQAKAQVPNDFILFPNLSSVTYEDLPQSDPTSDGTTVNVRGNFYGVMFKRSDLSKYLAAKKGVISADEPVDMQSLDGLDLAFVGGVPQDLLKSEQISFTVTGNAKVVWRTDENALRSDIVGKNKDNVSSILKNYPGIIGAQATVRPFWKSSFPSDASKINIKNLLQ